MPDAGECMKCERCNAKLNPIRAVHLYRKPGTWVFYGDLHPDVRLGWIRYSFGSSCAARVLENDGVIPHLGAIHA